MNASHLINGKDLKDCKCMFSIYRTLVLVNAVYLGLGVGFRLFLK